MAICLFTTKCEDGSGDVAQTVKVADFIQQFVASSELKEFNNEEVIVVGLDEEDKKLAAHFLETLNPNVLVKTMKEFQSEHHKINCCIEAGYLVSFNWRAMLSFQGEEPPIIVMPEYDNNVNRPSKLRILGGFNTAEGDVGVIPNLKLLKATAGEAMDMAALNDAFKQLDPKIRSYFGKDFESYLAYRENHDFSYQYSHDESRYLRFYTQPVADKPYQPFIYKGKDSEKTLEDTRWTPVAFFLSEHLMLMGDSDKSQDVLCLGEYSQRKYDALKMCELDLKNKNYTKISFIDIDNKTEEIIYQSNISSDMKQKEYRLFYSKSISFSSMQVLPLLARDIVGVTGDQSLVEAMSAGKLVTYECMSHKIAFTHGYLLAIKAECKKMEEISPLETSEDDLLLLAKFLIKPTYRANSVEYPLKEIKRLLSNRVAVEALKKINRQLVANSGYFASIEKLLLSHVLPYIKSQSLNEKTIHFESEKSISHENKADSSKHSMENTSFFTNSSKLSADAEENHDKNQLLSKNF